ncbi:metallophosphoesterase [Microbacterium ginsengisoli]|nr:metallophosphoesterase [Microbacteriaceae bacterium K1510]
MRADRLTLAGPTVAVAGDWHGNAAWATQAIARIALADSQVRDILHAGDFWPSPSFLASVDAACADAGVERVFVTLGNHEPWAELTPLITDGQPALLSERVWVLPRPYMFTVAGLPALSLGGASSVDRQWRVEGYSWWPDEEITDDMVSRAVHAGDVAIMITHESPESTPVAAVAAVLASNPHGFPRAALLASAASRARVSEVWDALRPDVLFHGHMHAPGIGKTSDGRTVVSLGCDRQPMNVVLLEVSAAGVRVRRIAD